MPASSQLSPPGPHQGFLFVRHGQSTDNANDMHSGGDADPELSDLGRSQAAATAKELHRRLAERLGDIRLIASPLRRTTETARIIAMELGIDPDAIAFEEGFLERRLGQWNGLTSAQVSQEVIRRSDVVPPGGEGHAEFRRRVGIVAHATAALAGPHCLPLVVSSRGVGRVLGWYDMPNAGLFFWPAAFADDLPGGSEQWPHPEPETDRR
ncbi:histidine phosphatase family protein [Telmatospirillum sp.]|uniref:histidine phosphatase family protein n=1 Tax=Telmatospirillum sp. TaxID=2079197 RepID=UPI00284E299B|nr:histidine phosphatase family protein [Telmatospirillum sp.]MDR3437248.1 histidine phosphatase family protein [Telmatospirillum sp.]